MKTAGSGVGRPVFGSRACRWMIAAPASAAPIAASAISDGVIGRCGVIVGVWIEPVTAQVMMTFWPAAIFLLRWLDVPSCRPRALELGGRRRAVSIRGGGLGRRPGRPAARSAKQGSISRKQASTNSLLMNQLVVQIVHSGAARNRTNLVDDDRDLDDRDADRRAAAA